MVATRDMVAARPLFTPGCLGITTTVEYCSPKKKYGFLLGTGCPLQGPLWCNVKSGGFSASPSPPWAGSEARLRV